MCSRPKPQTPIIYPIVPEDEEDINDGLAETLPLLPCVLTFYASYKCVGENEIVITDKNNKKIKDVEPEERVLTRNGWVEVLAVIPCGLKEVYRIKVGNNSLICSEDHKLDTDRGMLPLKEITDERVYCFNGNYKIKSREKLPEEMECYDLSVNSEDHTFLCNNISISNSGKTTTIVNMLQSELFYRGLFDKIYYFSPTAKGDPNCRFLAEEPNVEILTDYSDEYLNALLEYQISVPKKERDKICVVFDDAIHFLKRHSTGSYLAVKSRHYSCLLTIYVSQSFRSLDTKIRANSRVVCLARLSNDLEIQKIAEEYSGFCGGKQNFLKLYEYCLNDQPYSFMTIDLEPKTRPTPVVMLRFEKIIYPVEGGGGDEGGAAEELEKEEEELELEL